MNTFTRAATSAATSAAASCIARGIAAGAVAASACLATIGLSYAQAPAAPTPPNPAMRGTMPPMGQGMHDGREMRGMGGMHRMHRMRELTRLKTSLRLTPEQTALWDRAEQQMKPPTDMREQMKARHDRMAAMLDDPNFDPRKFAAEMDSMHAERSASHKAVRESWFELYDNLNPVQRGQVREFVRSHLMRGEHMRDRMREHMGGMHGPSAGQDKPAPAPR